MKKKQIFFVLFILACLTLIPIARTGYATGDDLEFAMTAETKSSFHAAKVYAEGSGRFIYYILKPFFEIPYYLTTNLFAAKLINIIFLVFDFILLALIVFRISSDKYLSYFTFLLAILFVNIKGQNNPITAFLWYYTFSFALILSSILFSLIFIRSNEKKYRLLSVIFYTSGLLFYEAYLVYAPLIAFLLARNTFCDQTLSFSRKIKKIFLKALPIIIVVSAYLLTYFLYRHFVSASSYHGTQFAKKTDLYKVIDSMHKLSSGSIPLFYYFNGAGVYRDYNYLIQNHKHHLFYPLLHGHVFWYVKAFFFAYLTFSFLKESRLKSKKIIFVSMGFSFFFFYFPNLIPALSDKYQNDYWSNSYVSSFFSFFAIILFLSFLLSLQNLIKQPWQKKGLLVVITILIALSSLLNDYANYHSKKDLQVPKNTFEAVHKFTETDYFQKLPPESFIYAPDLFINRSRISWVYMHIWTDYIDARTGKHLIISEKKEELMKQLHSDKDAFYLNFGCDIKNEDRYLAISKIKREASLLQSSGLSLCTDSLTLFYYSTYKDFNVFFGIDSREDKAEHSVQCNDSLFETSTPYVKIRCRYKNYNENFKPLHISAEFIDLQTLTISNKLTKKQPDVEF